MAKGNTRPFVNMACICENALQDKDGVLSAIRVIDTVFAELPKDLPPNAEGVLEYWCVIILKAGDLVGSFEKLNIRLIGPSGDIRQLTEKPIPTAFSGGANGINVRIKLTLGIKKYGLAWIDVLWGEDVLTSVPLDVKPLAEAPK
jgi:hypothetical protein